MNRTIGIGFTTSVALIAVVSLAACGTGAGLTTKSGAINSPAATSSAKLPQYVPPAGGLVDQIRQRGVIRNGLEAQNPPFEFVQKGNIVGYDVDLMQKLGEKLGVKVENIDTAWAGVIPSLYSNKFDLIWSAMTMTEPRRKAVGFSDAYASDQAVILVKAGNTAMKTINDLNGKIVGTQLNSAAELQIKQLQADNGLKFKDLKSYDHFDGAYLDLRNGNLDAVTGTKLNNITLFKNDPKSFTVAMDLPYSNYTGVATRKEDADLNKVVNELLAELKASGELDKLQTKWFGFKMDLVEK